jgi:integrase
MAYKVTLRKKKISGGRLSLYLDYYPAIPHPETGEPTRRKFLGLYILEKPKTPLDKQDNKETLRQAEIRCSNERNALNKAEIYTEYEKERLEQIEKGKQDFIPYFEQLANKRKSSNHDNWVSAGNYLRKFTGGSIQFKELNERFCEDFKEFLLNTKSLKSTKTKLKRNSAVSYFNKVKAALREAFNDGFLSYDLNRKVSSIKPEEVNRQYLTLDELKKLAETPCNNPLLKRVALFSALTGLRHSDIKKLTWGEVQKYESGIMHLKFRQKKTKGAEEIPIGDEVVVLMGERGAKEDKVFPGLNYSAYENKHLYQWIGLAGIDKEITFHCFRHTYAVLQLEYGANIYDLSQLMGHRNVKTTQMYSQIVDRKKHEAANRIKLNVDLS